MPTGRGSPDLAVLSTITDVTAVFSLFGSLLLLLAYFFLPGQRVFAFKLVACLSFSDAWSSMSYLIGTHGGISPQNGTAQCTIQAVLTSYFGLSSVLWTAVIAFTLNEMVRGRAVGIHKKERSMHIFAWGIPAILTILPVTTASYGPVGHVCWLKGDQSGTAWRFLQFYVPLWLVMIYNLTVMINVRAAIRRVLRITAETAADATAVRRAAARSNILMLYPAVLFVCWIFGTINRIQNSVAPNQPIFWLTCLHFGFGGIQGALNCLVYGLNPNVRRALFKLCKGGGRAAGFPSETRSGDSSRADDDEPEPELTVAGGGARRGQRRGPELHQPDDDQGPAPTVLKDVSYQVRSAYITSLGLYSVMGIGSSARGGGGGGGGGGGDDVDEELLAYRMFEDDARTGGRIGGDEPKVAQSGSLEDIEFEDEASGAAGRDLAERIGELPGRNGGSRSGGGGGGGGDGAAQPEQRKLSISQTYLTFFKSFVGLGVLALPSAFLQAGYILGTVGLCGVAVISYYCMKLLLLCKDRALAEGLAPAHVPVSFGDIGMYAFGTVGRLMVDVSLVISQCGFATAYLIFIGRNLHDAVLAGAAPPANSTIAQIKTAVLGSNDPISVTGYIMITAAVLVPLVWLKSLKKLAFTSLIADVIIVFGLVVIFIYDFGEMANPANATVHHILEPAKFASFPMFFGLAVYTFEGIGLVLPIQQSMQEPDQFPRVLWVGMISLTTLFVSFGLISYLAFGDSTNDMITLNLPRSPLTITVQFSYCVALVFTYPIMMFPAVQVSRRNRR